MKKISVFLTTLLAMVLSLNAQNVAVNTANKSDAKKDSC